MSERTPAAPNPTPAEQQPTPELADTPEQPISSPDDTASHEILEHSAQLEDALAHSPQLGNEVSEKASLRIRTLNGIDRAQSAIAMQELRQYGQEARTARLERKLLTVKPGSRRANRIQYKLNALETSTDRIKAKREKVFGRMHERSRGFEEEVKKVAEIEKKRNKFIVDRKVAIEKNRRRKVKKKYALEMKRVDPNLRQRARQELYNDKHRRERLHKEIASWKGNSLRKFEINLLAEVEKEYNNKKGSWKI